MVVKGMGEGEGDIIGGGESRFGKEHVDSFSVIEYETMVESIPLEVHDTNLEHVFLSDGRTGTSE